MLTCPYCGAVHSDTARFCPQCSRPLRRTCPQCGAENQARARFCGKCGAVLAPSEKLCPQCGQTNAASARFCKACGALLESTGAYLGGPTPPPPGVSPGTGLLPPQTLLAGRYIILRRVGRGGMGAVYQAADSRIVGKCWAVKELSDAAITDPLERQQAIEAFRREATMLAALDHPNLPKVIDHFSEGGKQYLVMDFIEGQTLAERLQAAGGQPLPVAEVLGWTEQLCEVLIYLHTRTPPIIFRDLKPANIMVTPQGVVKLIDFGIVRHFKPGKTADTAYLGTAGYAPREQYGEGQTDARSDIYALGATLHYLLSGRDPADHPFHFDDLRTVNPQVPLAVAAAIMKALAERPADRWQSVTAFRAALQATPPSPAPAAAVAPPLKLSSMPPSNQLPSAVPLVVPPAVSPVVTPPVSPSPGVQPAPARARSRPLRYVGWMFLGIILYSLGGPGISWRITSSLWVNPLAFVPALWGLLFGPGRGALVGGLGMLLAILVSGWIDATLLIYQVGLGIWLGLVPALLVKRPERGWAVFWAGVLTSWLGALGLAALLQARWSAPGGFGQLAWNLSVELVPAHGVLLPWLARWLLKPVRRAGLYWRDRP